VEEGVRGRKEEGKGKSSKGLLIDQTINGDACDEAYGPGKTGREGDLLQKALSFKQCLLKLGLLRAEKKLWVMLYIGVEPKSDVAKRKIKKSTINEHASQLARRKKWRGKPWWGADRDQRPNTAPTSAKFRCLFVDIASVWAGHLTRYDE
jgi:hypothetical protein